MIGVLFVIGLPLLITVLAFIFCDDSEDDCHYKDML